MPYHGLCFRKMQGSMNMNKQVVNLTIYLMKDCVDEIEDCLKSQDQLVSSIIKPQFSLNGKVFYCDSKRKAPRWKQYLDEYSTDPITISDNASNKAVMIIKVRHRILTIVFGYGRSFLKEECIERNFGLKVALNTIDPNKMRSVNATTIEDMVVNTQRQASYSTSQDEFGLNVTNDIMKGVTGEPYDPKYGKHISGKDSLVVSVFMELSELKEKLELYIDAYTNQRYKEIGFDWVDNVAEVRDSVLSAALDCELTSFIKRRETGHLYVAPPETTDWDQVVGFCYSGIKKKVDDPENYTLDLNLDEYIYSINPETDICQKLKRDKLYGLTPDGFTFVISSIYNALVFQMNYKDKTYILYSGTWYQVETSFFNQVNNYINTNIKISDLHLPECGEGVTEGDYNRSVANGNSDYCLFDCKMISVAGGPKKIEACDLFTRDKKFIHVKNKRQSAQLSHLFAQGKVSAECFISDEEFRRQVSEIATTEFGTSIFDYTNKPSSDEYEVVFAIIDDQEADLLDNIPFFSKVNLMLTAQDLDRMHFKYSVCLVKRTSKS